MKILLVTQFFWPEERTAPTNLGALAEDLAAGGHDVMVVTGVPNHPLGHVYDGYEMKLWQWERARGFRILRLPLVPDHSESPARRMLNYGSFTLSANTLGLWLSRRFRADVVFAYYAPPTMGLTSYLLRLLRRVPVVYWITDVWPENYRAAGIRMSERTYARLRRFEDWGYRQAAAICVDSPGYETNLRTKGVPADKIHVVAEWADENLFHPVERDPGLGEAFGLASRFNVMYGGNLGKVQHLSTAVEAASLVQDLEDVQFVFVGDGTDEPNLRRQVAEMKLGNVRFIPRRPMQEMPSFFAWADALLAHLQRSPIFELQLPSKVLAYLACGRPILCAVPGAVETIVRETGAGVACPSEDPRAMADLVRTLRAMPTSDREAMGRSGREAHLATYNRRVQVDRLEEILLGVVAGQGGVAA
jgi:colanic acid biosynthesis glycosyl transferase WcaI